jgi:hypothetical protein
MSFERWNYLWSFLVGGLLSVYLSRVAADPEGTRGGRLVVRALDSWFLRTRWSLEPTKRLRMMAVATGLLALIALILLILDPEPRYPR